jgi:hypothetical protein
MAGVLRLVALSSALGALVASPAWADAVVYDYDVYVGGSQVADMQITVDRSADRYRVTSVIELVGLAAMVSDWKAHGESEGRIAGGEPVPDRYASYNFVRGEDRRVEVAYAGGTVTEITAVPTNADDARDPVSADQQRNTLDPLTAVFAATLSPDDCGGNQRLFDGRRLTDVAIDRAGPSEAPPTDYGIYAGPAIQCTVTVTRRGGRSREWEGESNTPSQLSVWLAPVAGGLTVPVRLEAETNWGFLRGHLVGVHPLAPTN